MVSSIEVGRAKYLVPVGEEGMVNIVIMRTMQPVMWQCLACGAQCGRSNGSRANSRVAWGIDSFR